MIFDSKIVSEFWEMKLCQKEFLKKFLLFFILSILNDVKILLSFLLNGIFSSFNNTEYILPSVFHCFIKGGKCCNPFNTTPKEWIMSNAKVLLEHHYFVGGKFSGQMTLCFLFLSFLCFYLIFRKNLKWEYVITLCQIFKDSVALLTALIISYIISFLESKCKF